MTFVTCGECQDIAGDVVPCAMHRGGVTVGSLDMADRIGDHGEDDPFDDIILDGTQIANEYGVAPSADLLDIIRTDAHAWLRDHGDYPRASDVAMWIIDETS